MRKTRSSRPSSSRSAWLSASRYVIKGIGRDSARCLDQHVLEQRFEGRLGTLVRKVPRVLDDRAQFLIQVLQLIFAQLPVVFHPLAQQDDWVALLPFLQLGLRPISAARRIRHGVSHEAIRPYFEQ